MGIKISNEEFMNRAIENSLEKGNELAKIFSEITDEYDSHSLLKLVSISYWTGIFIPIANNLREKYHMKIAYVDAMAGSGVTKTKDGEFLLGSCPSAMIASSTKGCPFDEVFFVEPKRDRFEALKNRLNSLQNKENIVSYNERIELVSVEIGNKLERNTISYVVIDPQALQGLTWLAIEPLACIKGDLMLSWFEMEAWRMKEAALSEKYHSSKEGDIQRLDELFGKDEWRKASNPEELTQILIDRILMCKGGTYEFVKIPRDKGNYFLMILFTGRFRNAQKLSKEWKSNIERRIGISLHDLKKMILVKSGKQQKLF